MLFNDTKLPDKFDRRREIVFILLAGLFIGTLAMLNILGITRLIDLSFSVFGFEIPFRVFIGVLPYPITFLCTDIISEFYGRRRANYVVWVGFVLNIWVIFIMWIGGILPPLPHLVPETGLPEPGTQDYIFYQLQRYTFSTTAASMIAYLTAQFVDVHIFHYLKALSKGKMLWLRNNGSTLTSQLVDSLSVVFITFYFTNAIVVPEGVTTGKFLIILLASNYAFKVVAALTDTIPFYISVKFLTKYLNIDSLNNYKEK
jgi:queuosine precursor transporter